MDIGQPDTSGRARFGGPPVRRGAGRALLLLAAIGLLIAASRWLHHRFTHVLVEDARIAADMVTLSSRVPGWVGATSVTEGQAAARGAVLAVIDDRIAGRQLREIEAQLGAAAARRAEIEARIAMIDRQTTSQREAREARISAAEAALAASGAQLGLAEAEYGRAQRLVDTGAGTRARLDQMRAALDAGRQQVLGRRAEIADALANLAEVVAGREQITALRRPLDTLAEEERGLRSPWLMAGLDTNTPFWTLAIWIMLGRVGLALIMPSLNAGALRALPTALLGQGSGAVNFVRQLGGALGTNLLAVAVERRTQLYANTFAASQDTSNPATVELLRQVLGYTLAEGGLAEGGVAPGFGPESIGMAEGPRLAYALDYLGRVLAAQAGMMGYRDGFLLTALGFLLAIPPAFLMRRRAAAAA